MASSVDRPEQITDCLDTTPGPHRTDSDELAWWLPVIGPTASILAYTFVRHTGPDRDRTQLPALSERHLSRLPDQLATAYRHRRSRSVA